MSRKLQRWLTGIGAAATVALAWPAAAIEHGEYENGVYTAPGQLFTARSPLGPDAQIFDSFDRSAGAVTFIDEQGTLFGIICTQSFDVLAGAKNDPETDLAILRNWLHDATLPYFFASQMPGTAIVREEPGRIDGRPAWFAVMRLPQGGATMHTDSTTGLPVRNDAHRGLIVFSRDEITYLLMTEVDAAADWNAFMPQLAGFYQGMEFFGLMPVPVDYELAALLDSIP